MQTIKVKTEDGIETWREFVETRLIPKRVPNHINPSVIEGKIAVYYYQYKVVAVSNKVIPETITKEPKIYYVVDMPDILAPDGTIVLPSKKRFTNWCNYVTSYPLQEFFITVINDTLNSYPNLEDNAIIPDYTQQEIETALNNYQP